MAKKKSGHPDEAIPGADSSRRGFLQGMMAAALACTTGPAAAGQELTAGDAGSSDLGGGVLSLDELAGDWKRLATLANYPAINNFWGALQITGNLLAVTELTFPPFSQGMDSGNLSLNGAEATAHESRWYAYQILRRTRTRNLELESSVRMVFENRGVLFRLKLKNLTEVAQPAELKADLRGFVGRYDTGWSFRFPRPQDPGEFAASLAAGGSLLLVRHLKSPARVAFAFAEKPGRLESAGHFGRAIWNFTLHPGQERTLDYVMAVGNRDDEALSLGRRWAAGFNSAFETAKGDWARRYARVFEPGNNFYSGSLPVLSTPDEAMRRVYYMGVVSRLQLLRTNLPVQPRVVVTGGPQFAVTVTYFWDNTSFLMSMLDPQMMRQQLKRWLTLDIFRWYAQDCLSGEGRGRWYSANNVSVFALLSGHLRVTGDYRLLDEKAGGRTVLEHLVRLATGWKQLVPKGGQLADYGAANNLLECDPTYIHAVASLNAANVGMMRSLANLLEWRGQARQAADLRREAKKLARAVLQLYVPKEGVWYCRQPDGRRFKVRHVYDFVTVVRWMAEDLSPSMRREMVAFVERELLTEYWMRALSLEDPAAPRSDRPDHGPMGAYDEWPALTLEGLVQLGRRKQALDAFYRFEGVTREGPYAQAHEILGRQWDDPVRVASRGPMTTHNMIGSVFPELILRSFFGFQPDWRGKQVLAEPALPAGFRARLRGLPYRGRLYDLSAGPRGVSMQPR